MPGRDGHRRRVYRAAIAFFILVSLATVWPIYPLFSRIRPLILGLPFALATLVLLLILCFAVLLALYLWEESRGDLE